MGKSKQKPKDYNFMNWLDRKQSNKKERQQGFFKTVDELIEWQKQREKDLLTYESVVKK